MSEIPRAEYPRPQFERDNWMTLNGTWQFSFGEPVYDRQIVVPFACETALSGIGDTGFHPVVWYKRLFVLPEDMRGRTVYLHFGAVDYSCRVYVNGAFVGGHEGGHVSFTLDVTHALVVDGENTIELRAEDDYTDMEMPRGKQFWERESRSIFYSRTTGIWQSVWLEAVNQQHVKNCMITPLLDERAVRFEWETTAAPETQLEIDISFEGMPAAHSVVNAALGSVTVPISQHTLQKWNFVEDLTWSPENPRLFDVTLRLVCGDVAHDTVRTYFGMRKVSIENGVFMLNNRPYYQRLVLDQGYWPESLLTAPTDEAFVRDIELVKAMGFNGVRKHQKVEDPRFLYHADRMGLLVWGEMAAAYVYSRKSAMRNYREWQEAVLRDYNHPCIVAWTPLNESWGVQEILTDPMQQAHAQALYHMIHSLDATRPVIDNDGWEHTGGDILSIHDYTPDGKTLAAHMANREAVLGMHPGGRCVFARGYGDQGQPIMMTEFGGTRYAPGTDVERSWGYSDVQSQEAFLDRYSEQVAALYASPVVQGFCYTQLTDIETEENGLLFYDRRPKAPLEEIRRRTMGEGC